jgi:hypothetical protein
MLLIMLPAKQTQKSGISFHNALQKKKKKKKNFTTIGCLQPYAGDSHFHVTCFEIPLQIAERNQYMCDTINAHNCILSLVPTNLVFSNLKYGTTQLIT